MVYRRYTNFATESQPMYFDGTANFGQRISGVGKLGLFILAEGHRDLEIVYAPADYQVRSISDGFCLTSPTSPDEPLTFNLTEADPMRLSFWLTSLRDVGFVIINN